MKFALRADEDRWRSDAKRRLRRRSVRKTLLINTHTKNRNNNVVNIKKRRSIRKKIRNKFGMDYDDNTRINENCGDTNGYISSAVHEEKGDRLTMQDAHIIEINSKLGIDISIFGIFDGHGPIPTGADASEFVANNIQNELVEKYKTDEDLSTCLTESFISLDEKMKEKKYTKSGTTAVVSLITPYKIVVANTGDSRLIIVRRGTDGKPKIKFHTEDHKPSLPYEKLRIEKAGGEVSVPVKGSNEVPRINNDMAVSRALGDHEYKNPELEPKNQIISPVPDVNVFDRDKEDMFIVLASDGVWDVMSNEEVMDFVYRKIEDYEKIKSNKDICEVLKNICIDLVNNCLKLKPRDNVSAIIVYFNPSASSQSSGSVQSFDNFNNFDGKSMSASSQSSGLESTGSSVSSYAPVKPNSISVGSSVSSHAPVAPVKPNSISAGSSGLSHAPVASVWDPIKGITRVFSPTNKPPLNHKQYVKELKEQLKGDPPLYIKKDVSVNSQDALFIIDMQYDFVNNEFTEYTNVSSSRVFNTPGSLSAPESNVIIDPIIMTIDKFKKADANIIATKDYHPKNHCSFEKGSYSEHCVIGSKGAKIVNPIFQAIAKYEKSYIAFKGFSQYCDSYSAVPYSSRVKTSPNGKKFPAKRCGDTTSECKTGSYLVKYENNYIKTRADENKFLKPKPKTNFGRFPLPSLPSLPSLFKSKQSKSESDYDRSPDDAELQQFNPPPELFKSIEDGETNATLQSLIDDEILKNKEDKQIFICGLVGDICVLDTAINLRTIGYKNVYILIDLTRMVNIKNKYILSPKDYAGFVRTNGIKIIKSKHIKTGSLNLGSPNTTTIDPTKTNITDIQKEGYFNRNELYVPSKTTYKYSDKLDEQIAEISRMLNSDFNKIGTIRRMVGGQSSFKNSAKGFNIQSQYKSVDDIINQITTTCKGIKELKRIVNEKPVAPRTPEKPVAPAQPTGENTAPAPTTPAPTTPAPAEQPATANTTAQPAAANTAQPAAPAPAKATAANTTAAKSTTKSTTKSDAKLGLFDTSSKKNVDVQQGSVVEYKFNENVPTNEKSTLTGGNVYVRFLAKPFDLYMNGTAVDRLRIEEPLVKKEGNYVLLGKYSNTSSMTKVCDISGPYKEVFDFDSKNKDVYNKIFGNEVSSRVIVAFGLSGSGKTYTLMGTTENPGLIPRFIKENNDKQITCQSVQLYKGNMYDTLFDYNIFDNQEHKNVLYNDQEKFTYFNDSSNGKMEINTEKVVKDKEGKIVDDFDLKKLSQKTFTGYSAFKDVYEIIKNNRPTRSTAYNPDSSRSHLFIFFKVGDKIVTFVDLGGYENRETLSGEKMTEKEEEGIPINGELKVIKETFKQLLRNERNDGTIEDLMNDKNSSGARLGAWKILNYLLYKKPEVKLDIILCTQYYRGKPEYSDQGAICKNARTIKDSKTIYACNYFSRVWSLTNTTLQFGNFLLRGKDFIPTTTNRFGRRRSYQRIRKHTASPYASTLRVDTPYRKQLKSRRMSRKKYLSK